MVLGLLACVGHHAPVQSTGEAIDVVPVLESVEDKAVGDGPERLDAALLAALKGHNLAPSLVAPDRYVTTFAKSRDTARRVETLAPSGNLLLVESEVAYYSLLSGRYRWTVDVTLTLVPAGLTDHFEVPVFLEFQHEREAEALAAATPVITRHVDDLIDDWLSGTR